MSASPHTPARDEGLAHYLTEEFCEDYVQGRLTRREALQRIAGVMGSLALAESLLVACAPASKPNVSPIPATAPAVATLRAAPPPTGQATPPSSPTGGAAAPSAPPASEITVPLDDAAIVAGPVQFPGQGATIQGYLTRPKGDGPFPAVLVCHENRGLLEHFKDVTRRFGKAGYVALAVDLLSRQGGVDQIKNPADVPGLLANIPQQQLVQDFRDGVVYLQAQPGVAKGRLGMTGFCFGGGVTWRCATQMPELGAAVPFYGAIPPVEDVPKIQAAVLAIYGEKDTRITGTAPTIEEAMKQNGKVFEKIIYPNAEHAFFNDTGTRYNAEAARDAWTKMLAWFAKYLKL